ncbi:hypothetical protein F4810DRAFT_706074 [Camillea tinctor]|nr:hypothetical protein F4810DRAFT_706074 [Camillea tinctor]
MDDQVTTTMNNNAVIARGDYPTKDETKEDKQYAPCLYERSKKKHRKPVFPIMKLPTELRFMIYNQIASNGHIFLVDVYQEFGDVHVLRPNRMFSNLPKFSYTCKEMYKWALKEYIPVLLSCEAYCHGYGGFRSEERIFRPIKGYLHPTADDMKVSFDCECETHWDYHVVGDPRLTADTLSVTFDCNQSREGPTPGQPLHDTHRICLDYRTILRLKNYDLTFRLEACPPPGEELGERGSLSEIPTERDQNTELSTDTHDDRKDNVDQLCDAEVDMGGQLVGDDTLVDEDPKSA